MFLGINGVATPPTVSIESVKGVTSNNKTSLSSPYKTISPLSFPAWIAAPKATHSSGFKDLLGSI